MIQKSLRVFVCLSLLLVVGLQTNALHAKGVRVSIAPTQLAPGTIVVFANQRKLYFVLDARSAIRFPVAVERRGMEWSGVTYVKQKALRPQWGPPDVVRRDNPKLPQFIPGGAPGNPMGAALLMLGVPEIAIHGTSAKSRGSIGSAASYGCVRMLNEDILDLYSMAEVGDTVVKCQAPGSGVCRAL